MEAGVARPGYELWRPNREKAESKSAKAIVVLLCLATAGIVFIITIGGWSRLEGGGILAVLYGLLYVLFAYLVSRWQRGVLPVASALAIILAIFAAIAAPAWFDRAKDGLESPALPEEFLGLMTLVLVPLQVVLIAVAMVAFNQNWQVEEERPIGGVEPIDDDEDAPSEFGGREPVMDDENKHVAYEGTAEREREDEDESSPPARDDDNGDRDDDRPPPTWTPPGS